MVVSAYLDAARVIDGSDAEGCRAFALKTLDRMLKEVWTETRGFGHRIGGPSLARSLDDQVFSVLALLNAYETTLDPRYFAAAQKTMDPPIAPYAAARGGCYFFPPSYEAPPPRVFALGKSALRVTPQTQQLHLAGALKEPLPHLPAGKPLAVFCSGQTCLPPTSDPAQLIALFSDGGHATAAR